MKRIENGNFHHTLVSALSCVLLMAVAGVLVSKCSLDSLVMQRFNVSGCQKMISGTKCYISTTIERLTYLSTLTSA